MPESSNSYSPNYAEFITPVKKGKSAVMVRIAIIALTVFLSFLLLSVIMIDTKFVFFALIGMFGIAYLAWFLWRFTSIEYEYCIAQAEIQVDIIYGARQRKRIAEFMLSQMESISPLNGNISKAGFDQVTEAISSPSSPNAYRAVFRESDGKTHLLLFEANEKVLRIMRFYKASAFAGMAVR